MDAAPVSGGGTPRDRRWWQQPAWLAGEALLVFVIVFSALGGPARHWRVPLHYSEDALEYLMQSKGTLQDGWWWNHPRIGAPGTFEQLSYPSNTNVDQALIWVARWFTRDPGLAVNVTWLVMVALSSVIATGGFRLVGVSPPIAFLGGVLFALVPYALSRNIQHFSLAIYLVPIPCAAALVIAAREAPMAPRTRWWLAAGCVLVSLNYVYYAFFAAFVLLVAMAIAALRDWRSRALRDGALFLTVIIIVTAVNLAPSLRAWALAGKPLVIPAKTAGESDTYGLKIRQLLSPVPDHPLAIFARLATLERRAAFPIETENTTSRLGLVGSLGFLGLMATLVLPGVRRAFRDRELVAAAASLTLALVLLATVGGLGSFFSLLVSPEIRAYDRVCPFLAFFALVAVGLVLDQTRPRERLWQAVVVSGVLVIGVWDQIGAAAPLNQEYAANRTEQASVNAFVQTLEARLPAGAMVFQLPLTTYLNDAGEGRMQTYDEIKPYLASRTLHWSYPALDNAVVRWQHAVARLPPRAMAQALRDAGFAAVAIDRKGYADDGQALIAALTPAGQATPVLADSPDDVALDLAHVAASSEGVARLPVWTGAFGPVSTGLPACTFAVTAHIDSVGPLKAPVSGPLTVERAATYAIRGWAIDDAHQALAGDVDLVVDGQPEGMFYGVNRPDIAARAGQPGYRYSGVLAVVPTARLRTGPHRLDLRVVAADRSCASDAATLTVIVPPVV